MNPILKNVFAVVAGVAIGMLVNIGLVNLSGVLIPPPAGVDTGDMESLAKSMHLFEARHFIFPFLAHALGTLVAALIAAKMAASHGMQLGIGIGVFFLLGGIVAVNMLPAPMWFEILDLTMAYLPMGWLGAKFAGK